MARSGLWHFTLHLSSYGSLGIRQQGALKKFHWSSICMSAHISVFDHLVQVLLWKPRLIHEFLYSHPHYLSWLPAPYRAPGRDATCSPCSSSPLPKEPLRRAFHVHSRASNKSTTRNKSAVTHYRLTCLKCRSNLALTQTLKMALDLNNQQ